MLFQIITVILAFIIILHQYEAKNKQPKGFPPGPKGFPLLGHLPLLGKEPHRTLIEWQKFYGPIIGVWFGSYRSVVINDVKLIKEALNHTAFSGRPNLDFFLARCGGERKGVKFLSVA